MHWIGKINIDLQNNMPVCSHSKHPFPPINWFSLTKGMGRGKCSNEIQVNVVCKEEMYIPMANTSGQISLQLSSFYASLKTKNKTDPENHIWKNYHRWQCLFVYSLDNAHSIIYLHFIFTQKLPYGHFHSNRQVSSTAKREMVARGLKWC